MDTFQIADSVLDGYLNTKLPQERMNFLMEQAEEQLAELEQNKDLYTRFLNKINPPQKIDNIILWMLLMSDEDICDAYISAFKKNFRDIIPVSDLADLLAYVIHLKKVKNTTLDGLDFLLEHDYDGMEEVDQYCFTNILLYVQKAREVEMEF